MADVVKPRLAADTAENLRLAWYRWDDRPADSDRANAMEDAVQAAARELDMTGTALRLSLSLAREQGASIVEAVEALR